MIFAGRRFICGSLEAVLNELSDLMDAVSGEGVEDMVGEDARSSSSKLFGKVFESVSGIVSDDLFLLTKEVFSASTERDISRKDVLGVSSGVSGSSSFCEPEFSTDTCHARWG